MSNKDETLEIYLNDRIDADNARETEESILELLEENEHQKISINMSGLKFVTEDGIKALKAIGEKSKNVELTNVTDDIYEIFEKNGLTSIMPIHKKLKIDIE